MIQPAGRVRLAHETAAPFRIAGGLDVRNLQRHFPIEMWIVSEVYDAAAAAA